MFIYIEQVKKTTMFAYVYLHSYVFTISFFGLLRKKLNCYMSCSRRFNRVYLDTTFMVIMEVKYLPLCLRTERLSVYVFHIVFCLQDRSKVSCLRRFKEFAQWKSY